MTANLQPSVLHIEPVLPVRSVSETVAYWHEVLGFPDKWVWGDPPNHGGVSWHGGAFVQFSQEPGHAGRPQAYSLWVRVRDVGGLYTRHQQQHVDIVSPIESKPWGFLEYIVREMNGYYLTFAAPVENASRQSEGLPTTMRVVQRKPTVHEHQQLIQAVGWDGNSDHLSVENLLTAVVFGVVAENKATGEAIGCALLCGDGVGFYYIKDVMVHPAWQHRGIGTALMQTINDYVQTHAPENATIGLFTGEHLASFYRQFGFTQACGMYRQVTRRE